MIQSENSKTEVGDPQLPPNDAGPSDRVFRGLLKGLYEGAYSPGQRLAAPDLMAQFNVGRGTIREVLQRLASSGVVTMELHRGAQVRRLSRREVGEVLDIVEVLLGLAARAAAHAIASAPHRDDLVSCHDALSAAVACGDFERFLVARETYYRSIVRLGGNRELQRLFPGAQIHIMRVQLRRFQQAADSVHLADYSALTQAILDGDATAAEAAGRAHVDQTRKRVAPLPDAAFANERSGGVQSHPDDRHT